MLKNCLKWHLCAGFISSLLTSSLARGEQCKHNMNMYKQPFSVLSAVLLSVYMMLLPTAAQAQERIRLATQSWPPFQMVEEGQLKGQVIERVQCALREMGQPYELHLMRWDRAQLLVETNQFNGFFSGSPNSSRARYAVPSAPVVSVPLSWYLALNVELDVTSEVAKDQARYGAKFNTSKWLFLAKNGYNVVKKPQDAEALLRMLRNGDLDVALEYEDVFELAMKNQGVSPQRFKKIPYKIRDLSVHFSKTFLHQRPNFLNTFNAALVQCIKSES